MFVVDQPASVVFFSRNGQAIVKQHLWANGVFPAVMLPRGSVCPYLRKF